MPRKSRPYEIGLHERLRDTSHAISYINAAAEDSIEGFLLALRDVAEATKGMSKVAADADKNRENLYRMLSEEGNPRLDSLCAVLAAIGLQIRVRQVSCVAEDVAPESGVVEIGGPLWAVGNAEEDSKKIPTLSDFAPVSISGAVQWGGTVWLGQYVGDSNSVFSYRWEQRLRLPGTDQPAVPAALHSTYWTNSGSQALRT